MGLTEAELLAWATQDSRKLWTFRVADKFDNLGLTGILSLESRGTAGRIVDFVLSCRVIGRKVEETMLHTAITFAQSIHIDEVYADYVQTPRNEPCLIFLKRSGLSYDQETDRFTWKTDRSYSLPEAVTLETP